MPYQLREAEMLACDVDVAYRDFQRSKWKTLDAVATRELVSHKPLAYQWLVGERCVGDWYDQGPTYPASVYASARVYHLSEQEMQQFAAALAPWSEEFEIEFSSE